MSIRRNESEVGQELAALADLDLESLRRRWRTLSGRRRDPPWMINSGASGGARRRIPRGPTLENHPMKTTNSRPTQTAKPSRNSSEPSLAPPPASTPRPGGKLGDILRRVASKNGATADELVDATGWQKHSILGALSKLKSLGFAINLDVKANRKAYRLASTAG